jgi:hypothetical protein
MKKTSFFVLCLAGSLAAVAYVSVPPAAPNGITLVDGYRSWQVIAPSFRPDKEHIRLIMGNEAAVRACREGQRPFPDGAIFAKIAWSARKHPDFPAAVIPGPFAQVEFMIKDSRKFKATGGWGFARFVGKELQPYGRDAGFARECFSCHEPVAGNDFVFTSWAGIP